MRMFIGFFKLILLVILVLEYGVLAPNSWRATSIEVQCIQRERQALLQFKDGLGADNSSIYTWSSWSGHKHKRDCCQWEGIHCNNQTGHVLMLHLAGDFNDPPFQGKISASLMELQYLMYLNLSFNYFEDSYIPKFFGSLSNLRYLDLRGCNLWNRNIPSQLENLSQLQYLDLSSNQLEGAIPNQLANISRLQHLDLSFNQLEGVVPNQLGNLSQLQHLDLSFNQLEGEIPSQLANLLQLQHLDLSYNQLVGVIPYQLGSLSQLQHVDLLWNSLVGEIPYQFGNLSNLQKLFLGNGVALKFDQKNGGGGEWLSNLTSLTHLTLFNITNLNYSYKWLPMIGELLSLKELRLPQNDLSDQYILSLSSLKFNSSSLQVLDLSGNNFMSSAVFHWISNISSNVLKLDLGFNILKGPIPHEFGRAMNSLVNLDLTFNHLKGGLKSLGNICTLHSLSLAYNHLSEDLLTILQTLFGCARYSLQELSLRHNQISGTLVNLSTFTSLKTFDISRNLLNGSIPKDLQFSSSLESLDIHSNSLKGSFNEIHFANTPSLKNLVLSGNMLALNFSHNWVPLFQLQAIHMGSCMVGPSFPKWLQTQNIVVELDISNSGIIAPIPVWFWPLLTPKLRYLNISCNNFIGTMPNVPIKFISGPFISVASNHFEGEIPQFLRDAVVLFASNNNFSDANHFLSTPRATNMQILDVSNNQLSGQLPDCWGQFKRLSFLDLSNNNFSGEFPTSIGSLKDLHQLILRNNKFTGELPITLGSCSYLRILDAGENNFSGRIPSWIGTELHALEILILRNNNFSGSLPLHLCYLSRIHFLDLSLNNLSGRILRCFKNFTEMALESNLYLYDILFGIGYVEFSSETTAVLMWKGLERTFKKITLLIGIDLSSNQLTGRIPIELGNLVLMVSMNLSRNQLSGEIPSIFGQLTSLDFLDLSRNHLYGPIPSSLTQIDRLSVLDLSYNNLSGKIPISTQLQSFHSTSYEGNLNLCGKPLEKICPEEEKSQKPTKLKEDEHESILSKEFYWSMSLGFITGFWGIFGSILFSRSWRHAYFKFLNNLTDTMVSLTIINMTRCNRRLKSYLERLR
ncbi:receptor-like protein EIX2 [Prosopis cineraria]|uniref:receptor-like protein EIX2 n=1 Tax=Prosopis cineraria TaxID=364024 RepID=UPI00240F0559|nr:receptor-like protein EIX2 [Prosopis cineraria]